MLPGDASALLNEFTETKSVDFLCLFWKQENFWSVVQKVIHLWVDIMRPIVWS